MIYRKRYTFGAHAANKRVGPHLVGADALRRENFVHVESDTGCVEDMLDMRSGEEAGAVTPFGTFLKLGKKRVATPRTDMTDAAWNQMSVAEHFYAMEE